MTFSPRFTLVAIAFAVGAGTTLVLAVKAYAPKSSTLAIDASNAKYAPQVPALLEDERREYSHPPAEAIKISERATQGTWNLDPEVWPDVTLDLDELWHSRAVDNNSWEYLLHSLYILHDLAIAHQQTGDQRHLELGWKIVRSWHVENERAQQQAFRRGAVVRVQQQRACAGGGVDAGSAPQKGWQRPQDT